MTHRNPDAPSGTPEGTPIQETPGHAIARLIAGLKPRQRLLGLDVGSTTIGLAISDFSQAIATPLETIARTKLMKDIEALRKIVKEREVGALVIGLAAGVICVWGVNGLKRALGADDSLDVFGVHGIGGIVGAILTGVFAVEAIGGTAGLLEGNVAQVWIQIYGILATIIWCALATFVILIVLKYTIGLRVPEPVEIEGLDVNLHGEVVH